MAETAIFAEQTLTGFSYAEMYGCYAYMVNEPPFTFVEGKEYTVMWDGTEYVRTAFSFQYPDGSACIAVGNTLAYGGENSGEPFVIIYDMTNDLLCFMSLEAATAHTVALYTNEISDDAVIIKDRYGNDINHEGFSRIRVRTADGGTKYFADADTLPTSVEITVEPDFSNGDMEVTPETGKVFSKVGIASPKNLIPENIAEGVDIAGIVGKLAASGGGGNLMIASGTTSEVASARLTIPHNLGVVPDMVFVYGNSPIAQNYITFTFGFSSAFVEKTGNALKLTRCRAVRNSSFQGVSETYTSGCIDETSSINGVILSTNAETFTISIANGWKLNSGACWLAIGGI